MSEEFGIALMSTAHPENGEVPDGSEPNDESIETIEVEFSTDPIAWAMFLEYPLTKYEWHLVTPPIGCIPNPMMADPKAAAEKMREIAADWQKIAASHPEGTYLGDDARKRAEEAEAKAREFEGISAPPSMDGI